MFLIKSFSYQFLLLLSVFPFCLKAQSLQQSIVASAGNFYADANYSVSSTIGEVMSETFSSSAGPILTQGFQQVDGYFVQVQELHRNSNITVYPNPFRENVYISINDPENQIYYIELVDLIGRKYNQIGTGSEFKNGIQTIDTKKLVPGIYFIQVSNEKNESIGKFKIIRL